MNTSEFTSMQKADFKNSKLIRVVPLDLNAWLKAIKRDDDVEISQILATSTIYKRNILLHEPLISSEVNFANITTHKIKFTRPFTLGAVYGSLKVCDVMIRNDVNAYLQESESCNIIHCLICVAFYQMYNEEAVVDTYHSLCRMLSKDVIQKLLHMEETNGLRPLEFAAHLGTFRMMSSIFETPEMYVTKEEVVGVSLYQWYDITEYELIGAPGNRYSASPTKFFALIDVRHLDRPNVRKMMLDGMMAEWIQRSIRSKRYLIILYALFRIFYFSILFIYEMDSKWLDAMGKIPEGELHGTKNSSYPEMTYCNSALSVTLNAQLRIAFEIFLTSIALLNLIYEIWTCYVDFYHKGVRKFPYTDLNGRKVMIMLSSDFITRRLLNIGIAILTISEIILLRTTPEHGYATTVLSIIRALSLICIQVSMIYFLQTYPGIGYVLILMRKMNWTFLLCFAVIVIFVTVFSHFEILFFNINSNEGCIDVFSSYLVAAMTLLSTLLSMFNYKHFDVMNALILYLSHACYVFIVGVLMYNLLIAILSETITKVHERRKLEMTLCQLLTYKYLERKVSEVPILRTLYRRLMLWQLKRNYVSKNGRYFLVCARNRKTKSFMTVIDI